MPAHSKRAALSLTLYAGLSALASSAAAAPPADTDAYVSQAMQAFGAPGLSLSIVENGQTLLAKGYGVRRLNTSSMVDAHTAFPIGSETKAFTAAALAILVDRKKLGWDDRVADRLPGFQMYDPYATAHMTVRDLLTHRSGLGLGEGDLLVIPDTNRSRADIVHALRYLKPVTGFREKFAYDNILYIVAGELVEQVSGQSWEQFISDNIFRPAGMTDAYADYQVDAPNNVALHGRLGGQMRGLGNQAVLAQPLWHAVAPAGGINLSASDMAKWMTIMLAHGRLADGRQLFSEVQATELLKPVVVVPKEEFALPPLLSGMAPDLQTYALGWFVEDYHGHIVIEHSGAVFGALAMLYLIPEKNVGIAVAINSEDSPSRRAVTFHLLDHYLGLPPTDWISKLREARTESIAQAQAALRAIPAPTVNRQSGPALALSQYAGTYNDAWYGSVTIKQGSGGKLAIQFDRTPGMDGALEPVANNLFRTRWKNTNIEDAYVAFDVKAGRIQGASMRAVSPLADFSFDFQDLHLIPASIAGQLPRRP